MSANKKMINSSLTKGAVLLATGLLAAQCTSGSSVIMSPPPLVVTPTVVQEDAVNNEMNVFIPAGVVNNNSSAFFDYGPVTLHPHASYSFLYGSGIQSSANDKQNTIVQEFSPGLTADLGRHWTVDYTPSFNFYSSDKFHNVVNQSASLKGALSYEDWGFGLSQTVSDTSDPQVETAAQTDQQSYGTDLSANYAFNDKMTANFGVSQNFQFVSGQQNSYNWSTSDGLSYQFFPRLSAGFSLGGGYTKVENNSTTQTNSNPDSVNEQLEFTVNWRATDKISFQVSAGLNDEQYLAAGYSDSLNPIFSASIQYQPFKVTQISLSAARTVSASDYYIIAQSSENTTVTLSVSQRILVKYNLTLTAGYTETDYTKTLSDVGGTARSDNGYTFNASFGRSFFKNWNWSLTYQYGDNSSSIGGYSQRNNQVGLQVGCTY